MHKVKRENGIVLDFIDWDKTLENIMTEYQQLLIQAGVTDNTMSIIIAKKEEQLTQDDVSKIFTRNEIDKLKNERLSKYDDYKDIVNIPYSGEEPGEYETLEPILTDKDDKTVEQTFRIVRDDGKIRNEINRLKKELSGSDYKIIKMYEAKVAMTDMPYSATEENQIIAERQLLRDKINELEALLS